MASNFGINHDGIYGQYTGSDGNDYTVVKKVIVITSKYSTYDGVQNSQREQIELFTDDGQDVTPHSGDTLKIVLSGVILTPKD